MCLLPVDPGSLSNVGHATSVAGSRDGRVEAEDPDVGYEWVMKSMWEVGTGCRLLAFRFVGCSNYDITEGWANF